MDHMANKLMANNHLAKKGTTRRRFFAVAGGAIGALGPMSFLTVLPARATTASMARAIRDMVGEAPVTPGKVKLDLPPLVENGNTVPLTVTIDSPMTATNHVKRLHLFNEKNPESNIATFHLGPRAGRAVISTRVRLADTQSVVAIAELSDGSFWSDSVDVIVTIAACTEEVK
jgi:sulfur-oxidizing protein SoxY